MSKSQTQLQDMLLESLLPFGDQLEMMVLFMLASDDQLTPLVALCTEDAHMLEVFNDNRKKKQAALAKNSTQMWKELLEEEKQLLQK